MSILGAPHALLLLSPFGPPFWDAVSPALAGMADIATPDLRSAVSISEMADQVLAGAPKRFSVAGACLGGHVVFEILRRAPERISRIALLNASARPDEQWRAENRKRRIESLRRRAGEEDSRSPDYIENALPWMVARRNLDDPAIVAHARASLLSLSVGASLNQQIALATRPDSRNELRRIDAPTLILSGKHDRLCGSALSVEMARTIAHSRHIVLEPCGHLAPVEQPQAVASHLKAWLALPESA